MVKKIVEDVVISPQEAEPTKSTKSLKIELSKTLEPTREHDTDIVEKSEFNKEMHHVEDILPEKDDEEIIERDDSLERSPIFKKMKQTHDDRESFRDEYTADRKGGFSNFMGKGLVVLFLLSAIGVGIWSTIFYTAHVTIHLKQTKAALNNQEFIASSEATNTIKYQVMSLSAEDSVKLTPTGEKMVTSKATGKILIYNNFNNQNQILVKNTRFETPDGKIFRIDKQVVIPGVKIEAGKSIPGSVEAVVFADEAGSTYNIGLVDFTIPGFKGSPRYTKFYGRSKTTMFGGASGIVKTISDTDKEKAKTDLTKSLREKLLADAKAKKPDGTVLYPDAIFYTFTEAINDKAQSSDKEVPFILKGTLDAVLFSQADLSRMIVATAGETSKDDKINIDNIEGLTFSWKTPKTVAPEKDEKIDFLLSGSVKAVWSVDVNEFKTKLAGIEDSRYNSISVQFAGIEKTSKHIISPIWLHSYPKDVQKIFVETIID